MFAGLDPSSGRWSGLGNTFRLARSAAAGRFARPLRLGTLLFAAATMVAFAWRLLVVLSVEEGSVVGVDRGIYKEAALRWAGGGFWFYPEQVAGPYTITQGHVLYPSTALAWLVPAAYLPDALWWGIPCCVIAGVVWHHRPAIWAWPAMGLCLSTFSSVEIIASGNPGLWIAMFVAIGTVWRPAFAFVLLKPSLFPFALLGIRDRRWWLAVGLLALISLPLLPLLLEYPAVILNAGGDPLYSLRDVPLLLVPLLAWTARRRSPASPVVPAVGPPIRPVA